jgi:hypothetical protein
VPATRHDGHGDARQISKSFNFCGLALPVQFSNVNFAAGWRGEFARLRKLEETLGEWRREPWAITRCSSGSNNRGEQQNLARKWIQQSLRMQEKIGSKGIRYDQRIFGPEPVFEILGDHLGLIRKSQALELSEQLATVDGKPPTSQR